MPAAHPRSAEHWIRCEELKPERGVYVGAENEYEFKRLVQTAFHAATGRSLDIAIDCRIQKMRGRRPHGHRGTHPDNIEWASTDELHADWRRDTFGCGSIIMLLTYSRICNYQ